ncbi:MAG TPA: STAS domain-containing protein [Azonexus sp.]|nr:STAS domain-containing protein [Azonexus sp.]
MADGNVYYAEQDGTVVVRFLGDIRYTIAPALDRFLDKLFARRDLKTIIVDLSDTESIDSTGLGLLARIANFLRRRDGSRPLLFSSQPDINAVLSSICLDTAFIHCDQRPDLAPGTELAAGNPSETEVAQTVLEAHRLLCEMNDANRAQFQDVVEAFERELGKS